MRKINLRITLIIVMVLLVSLAYYFRPATMHITSVYPLKVSFDGKELGATPYTLWIFDAQKHHLELEHSQSASMAYDFDRYSMPQEINIPYSRYNDWQFEQQKVTADGKWFIQLDYKGAPEAYLISNDNPNEKKLIVEQKDGSVWSANISPDGNFVIYLGGDSRSLWLTPVGQPEKRIRVFEKYADCIQQSTEFEVKDTLSTGFSPDSRWVWVTGNCMFAITPVSNPQEIIFETGQASAPRWSADGRRFAFSETGKADLISIYDIVDGNFQLFSAVDGSFPYSAVIARSPSLSGQNALYGYPWYLSKDGRYLWYVEDEQFYGPEKYTIEMAHLVDLEQQGKILISFEAHRLITITESPDGKFFAFAHDMRGSDNNVLRIVSKDGSRSLVFSDLPYRNIETWTNDSQYLLVSIYDVHSNWTLVKLPDF